MSRRARGAEPKTVGGWLDREDAAALLGCSASSVSLTARAESWGIRVDGGETLYYLPDVERTAKKGG